MNDLTSHQNVPGGFVRIVGYVNSKGEVAHHLINGAVSYMEALRRSLEATASLSARNVIDNCPACGNDFGRETKVVKVNGEEIIVSGTPAFVVATEAIMSQRASWSKSLAGQSEVPDLYDTVAPGVQTKDGTYYIWGLTVSKEVVEAGEYKPVKSAALTLVKRYVVGLAPVSKFRRFRLDDNFSEIRYNNVTINNRRAA